MKRPLIKRQIYFLALLFFAFAEVKAAVVGSQNFTCPYCGNANPNLMGLNPLYTSADRAGYQSFFQNYYKPTIEARDREFEREIVRLKEEARNYPGAEISKINLAKAPHLNSGTFLAAGDFGAPSAMKYYTAAPREIPIVPGAPDIVIPGAFEKPSWYGSGGFQKINTSSMDPFFSTPYWDYNTYMESRNGNGYTSDPLSQAPWYYDWRFGSSGAVGWANPSFMQTEYRGWPSPIMPQTNVWQMGWY